ncbi:Inhibitor of Apoptosis domain containing protein [Ophiocordyceps sinensis CO18]|uniref:Inhibitor of Apoptosis domain containing protein n=1 Tax=Ophiocordyceps sinensis (strain Co18 / CGMCC 3.14243) TaxID=911162 RepID=T5AIV6_OPHSC|nr:Inhibitor of Apoptosis domain containing protein [Ophiocordyceps sinensis CO18]
MAADETDKYITYEARLASFQKTTKKRGSAASGRGKALSWTHKQIAPASLAGAGFYFSPTPASPDNVTCFLCGHGLDGWGAGDDPLLEHLKHASHCGWAVVAAIQAGVGEYAQQDPNAPDMMEARKATFAGMWPHEGKKGWKCKTKQLVDSGWKYTPTAESDDMATCAYCELALDGWEPGDKPYDEHYNRSPECTFFALVKQFEGPRRKTSRAKASRGSKASRLSVQSVASEAHSAGDTTAVGDDSIVTTSSIMTQGGKKARAKKGAAPKSSRSKAKKNEPAEIEHADDDEEVAPPPKPAKSTRGRKRGSEAVDDASTSLSEAPATKKRATRTRSSAVTDASTIIADDSELVDVPGPSRKASGYRKNPGSSAKTSRQVSALSTVSTASMASLRRPADEFPDDEEIERQLEADLARESDEGEEMEAHHAELNVERHQEVAAAHFSGDYAMFDPAEADADDAAVEEELLALQEEMQVDEPEQPQVPQKGRKATTRKASEQTKPKSAKAASPLPEEEAPVAEPPSEEVVEDLHDATAGSTDTVMRKAAPERPEATKRGRGRPSKASLESQQSVETEEPPPAAKRGRGRYNKCPVEGKCGRPTKASLESRVSTDSVEPANQPVKGKRGRPCKASLASRVSTDSVEPADQPVKAKPGRPCKSSLESQASVADSESKAAEAPAKPKRGRGRPPLKPKEVVEALPPQPDMAVDEAQAEADDVADATGGVEAMHLGEGPGSPSVVKEQDAPPPTEAATQHLTGPHSTPAHVISPAPWASEAATQHLTGLHSTPARVISPAPWARQAAALSPSPSPQSSDAENRPPSSKPPASTTSKRVVLAPVTATPTRGSPAKRNVLAGLESSTPWTAVNLEAVLGSPGPGADKENTVGRMLSKGKELTSPEKGMTVEEWIYFNAGEAEKKLKRECETMVSKFEREGTRAINVLEGLSV